MSEDKLTCVKCNKELTLMPGRLEYMGSVVKYDFLTCPDCGAVYIPPELAAGKIHDVETSLEDK